MGGRCAIAIITLNETLPDVVASSLVCSPPPPRRSPPHPRSAPSGAARLHAPCPSLPIPTSSEPSPAHPCPAPGLPAHPCPALGLTAQIWHLDFGPPGSSQLDSRPPCPSLPSSGSRYLPKAPPAQLDIGHFASPAESPGCDSLLFGGPAHGPRPPLAGMNRAGGPGRCRGPSTSRLQGLDRGVRGRKGAEGRTPTPFIYHCSDVPGICGALF